MEWAVTALFIQRLNSLRGEVQKCQCGEDGYERYRSTFPSPKRKTPPPPSTGRLPHHSLRLVPRDAARPEGGIEGGCSITRIHPFLLFSFFFCWQCMCFTSTQVTLTKGPSQARGCPNNRQGRVGTNQREQRVETLRLAKMV